MSLTKKLYELQQTESEIQKYRDALGEINHQLTHNTTLIKAKEELSALQFHLDQKQKQQRDLEWQIDDIETTIKQLNNKLYGGSIKNPKELVSLEKEAEVLGAKLKQREEELLDLMAEIERMHHKVILSQEQLKKLEAEWQAQYTVLAQKQVEVESQLIKLNQKRDSIVSELDPQILQIYQGLRLRKGQAVVKVEQGKCQGCHITLPVSEWQKVKTGNLALCSSCGRILFVG